MIRYKGWTNLVLKPWQSWPSRGTSQSIFCCTQPASPVGNMAEQEPCPTHLLPLAETLFWKLGHFVYVFGIAALVF